jgi:hypothetical protein
MERFPVTPFDDEAIPPMAWHHPRVIEQPPLIEFLGRERGDLWMHAVLSLQHEHWVTGLMEPL